MGRIISKIKQDGWKQTFKVIGYVLSGLVNRLFYNVCRCLPLRDVIIFESEGDYSDNAYALYEYIAQRGFTDKYKAVWLVDDLAKFKGVHLDNTVFCRKLDIHVSFKRAYYLAIARFYLFDHNLVLSKYKRRKGQKIVYLTHGAGFKAAKGTMGCDANKYLDCLITTGPVAKDALSQFCGYTDGTILDLGMSRNDYLFGDASVAMKKIDDVYQFSKYKKVVLWMPTFRKSDNKGISEDYANTETCLPLFDTMEKLKGCDDFLQKQNVLMILKVHHLSANLPIYSAKFHNILIVRNDDIEKIGIQLYEFVACTDILLTDYSSISMDYLLLNRPMIFTIDDYKQYEDSRGFYPANAKDYMPGHQVETMEQLFASFEETFNDRDPYREDRERVMKQYHTYRDGNTSKRIVEYLKL